MILDIIASWVVIVMVWQQMRRKPPINHPSVTFASAGLIWLCLHFLPMAAFGIPIWITSSVHCIGMAAANLKRG